ncbi:MAG: outer membrane protein assembly factor BamD [Pseudomonas sp.]
MRVILLLAFMIGLVGCASTPKSAGVDEAALVDVRAKLSMGRCDQELANEIRALNNPQLEQEAAYICLQQGQLLTVERLLGDYVTRHGNAPNVDYSVYLLALTEFIRFELAEGDANDRLSIGRRAHEAFVSFVRRYPESAYRPEVAPRLEMLHEGMAKADYQLAIADIEAGRREVGASRLRYVVQQYPRSDAARDASRWLEQRTTP